MAKEPLEVSELASEVANKNFENEQLNKRLGVIVEGLAKDPKSSLPKAFDSAGLEGAYRFFSNPRVTAEGILSAHFAATNQRCGTSDDFLVAHDSSTFTYRADGERSGLGRMQRTASSSKQVFFAHVSLAISADGTRRPLGVAGFKTWTREAERTGVEYQRWEEQIRAVSTRLDGGENAIHLADREADDYEMFYALQRDKLRFVVRCLHNRRLTESMSSDRLHALFATLPSTVEREVQLERRKPRPTAILRKIYPAREARMATLCISGASVTLKKPMSIRPHTINPPDSVTINVVRVWEPNPPEGGTAIEWYLYTSEPIDTAEQQLLVVDYYRARWRIEEYFKCIKTGCDFLKRQLQDYEALVNLLATFAPIAYRLLLIRSEAVREPDRPGTDLLSSDQLEVLRVGGRLRLPAQPTAREIYYAVAALGGHIKYSGNPGWLTLARGYEKLETLTAGWRLAKLQPASDQG
jgi:hypothetical protein